MDEKEILEMAKQLKYTELYADGFVETSRTELIAFARLIAAKQREIDAGICFAIEATEGESAGCGDAILAQED